MIDSLRRLVNASGRAAEVGRRLWVAVGTGRLAIRTHPFSCAPLSYHHLPDDLAREFATASITILKGDLNYRRLVGDCNWPPTAPFDALSAYWPSPLAVLRTLKRVSRATNLLDPPNTVKMTRGEVYGDMALSACALPSTRLLTGYYGHLRKNIAC